MQIQLSFRSRCYLPKRETLLDAEMDDEAQFEVFAARVFGRSQNQFLQELSGK